MQNIVNRNVLNLGYRIFKANGPTRSLMHFVHAKYKTYHTTIPATLMDRV